MIQNLSKKEESGDVTSYNRRGGSFGNRIVLEKRQKGVILSLNITGDEEQEYHLGTKLIITGKRNHKILTRGIKSSREKGHYGEPVPRKKNEK